MTPSRCCQARTAASAARSCASYPSKGTVIVDGANMAKRHTKARGQTMQGGIIDKDMPLPASAVAIVCPACGKPSQDRYARGRDRAASSVSASDAGRTCEHTRNRCRCGRRAGQEAGARRLHLRSAQPHRRSAPPVLTPSVRRTADGAEGAAAGSRWRCRQEEARRPRSTPAPQAALRLRGPRQARRDARALQRDGGPTPREDRGQHGCRPRDPAAVSHRGSGQGSRGHNRAEAARYHGPPFDRPVQAPRGSEHRREGHHARRPCVGVPRPAHRARDPEDPRLPRALAEHLSTATATTRSV